MMRRRFFCLILMQDEFAIDVTELDRLEYAGSRDFDRVRPPLDMNDPVVQELRQHRKVRQVIIVFLDKRLQQMWTVGKMTGNLRRCQPNSLVGFSGREGDVDVDVGRWELLSLESIRPALG